MKLPRLMGIRLNTNDLSIQWLQIDQLPGYVTLDKVQGTEYGRVRGKGELVRVAGVDIDKLGYVQINFSMYKKEKRDICYMLGNDTFTRHNSYIKLNGPVYDDISKPARRFNISLMYRRRDSSVNEVHYVLTDEQLYKIQRYLKFLGFNIWRGGSGTGYVIRRTDETGKDSAKAERMTSLGDKRNGSKKQKAKEEERCHWNEDAYYTVSDNIIDIYPEGKGVVLNWYNGMPDIRLAKCTKIIVHNGFKEIKEGAFDKFTNGDTIKEIEIGNSVEALGDRLLHGMTGLVNVGLPEKLEDVGEECFAGCKSLRAINLQNAQRVGKRAFEDCTGLRVVALSPRMTNISYRTFDGCASLENVVCTKNIKHIGDKAFRRCRRLDIDLSRMPHLETIGEEAFSETGIKMLVLRSKSDVVLGRQAFSDCTRLVYIGIKGRIVRLGDETFKGCWRVNLIEVGDGSELSMSSTLADQFAHSEPSYAIKGKQNIRELDYLI